jgi:hypothetical protein
MNMPQRNEADLVNNAEQLRQGLDDKISRNQNAYEKNLNKIKEQYLPENFVFESRRALKDAARLINAQAAEISPEQEQEFIRKLINTKHLLALKADIESLSVKQQEVIRNFVDGSRSFFRRSNDFANSTTKVALESVQSTNINNEATQFIATILQEVGSELTMKKAKSVASISEALAQANIDRALKDAGKVQDDLIEVQKKMQVTKPYLTLEEIEKSLEEAAPHSDDEISLADTSISSHSDSTQALDDELDALAEEYERELDRELEELDRASENKRQGKHTLSLDRPPPPSSHVEQVQQSSNEQGGHSR